MRRLTFVMRGVELQGQERQDRRRRRGSRSARRGPRSLGRLAGLTKVSTVLLALAVLPVAHVITRSTGERMEITGPVQTAAGPKWELRASVPKRLRNVTLVINGAPRFAAVRNGHVATRIDLIVGNNTIQLAGGRLASAQQARVVPPNRNMMTCDCRPGMGGLAGAIANLFGTCSDTEKALKAGQVKWCDPEAQGPRAWPKKPGG